MTFDVDGHLLALTRQDTDREYQLGNLVRNVTVQYPPGEEFSHRLFFYLDR